MKNHLVNAFILVAVLFFSACQQPAPQQSEQEAVEPTTFIIVRHAEKVIEEGNDDPLLTDEGQDRANRLATMLSRTKLDAVYATQYQRNKLTVIPTAAQKGLEVIEYSSKERGEFMQKLLDENPGKTILMSAHSNSSPALVNILTGLSLENLDESDYNNIYIVTTSAIGKGSMVNLFY